MFQGAKLTGGDRVLLKEDTGAGGDVEAGAVRDNEEDEVPFKPFAILSIFDLYVSKVLLLICVSFHRWLTAGPFSM